MAANGGERHATIEPVLNSVRRRGKRPIIGVDCFDVAPELAQQVGAMTVRLSQIRCECQRAIETRQGFLVLSERGQRPP